MGMMACGTVHRRQARGHRLFLHAVAGLVACGATLAASASCGAGGDGAADGHRKLTVFAASSLTEVFEDIVGAFEEAHPTVEVVMQFAGSSRLAAQISAGAAADVFAAADERSLLEIETQQVAVFARNRLAIATPPDNPADVSTLDSLTRGDLLLALCAPDVPCGALATQVGGDALVDTADTLEPSVRSVLTKVLLGEVDAGVVYVTDLLAAAPDVAGVAIEHPATTPYPLAQLTDSPDAAAFVDFVLSPQAQMLLADAGFEAP